MTERLTSSLLCALCLPSIACTTDSEPGAPGSLAVHASGEEASREGFPVGEGADQIAFADGFTLEFHHVLVSIAELSLRTADGEDAELDADPVVADLHLGEPELWSFDDVPARRWDRVGFKYVPATEDSREVNEVDRDMLERMIDGGYSLFIAATARKDDREIALEYGFDFEVEMSHCASGLDETDGIVVPEGAAAEAQITVHLDHLFFDDYADDEAELRFEAMAAVAPAEADEPLTLEHLAEQDNLSDPFDAEGNPLDFVYDPGSTFDPVPVTLRDFVIAAATTTGHWNGEGHCRYVRRD